MFGKDLFHSAKFDMELGGEAYGLCCGCVFRGGGRDVCVLGVSFIDEGLGVTFFNKFLG